MLSVVKNGIRKIIRSTGFDVHRLDGNKLGGTALLHELPELVDSEYPVVVDVGANRGQRIELVRHAFSSFLMTSFEPNPSLAGFLRSKYDGVATIVEAAVGNVQGEMDLHIYANDRLSSLRDLDEQKAYLSNGDARARATVKVPVVRLDEFWREHRGAVGIDVLFIDAQGFDREVLEGAEGLLNSGKVATIVTDVYCSEYYNGQHNYLWEVEPWLRQRGYGLVGLYEIIREGHFISAAAGCFKLIPEEKPVVITERPIDGTGTGIAA
jgi:FkbM family methyltransferase